MNMHTTNYENTLIEIAEDCPTQAGEMPPLKGDKKSIANIQFDMIYKSPYKYTSDDVLFSTFALRKEFTKSEWDAQRAAFFSKGQPCLRASPLGKRYGFGVHSDENGKIAIFGAETTQYADLVADESVKKVKAMRSNRV